METNMINVNIAGVVHQVATLAEARALAGVAPKPTATATTQAPKWVSSASGGWGSEEDGICNRCAGQRVFKEYGVCFRCKGTGVAPGYTPAWAPVAQVEETENQYLNRLGVGWFTPAQETEYQSLMSKQRLGARQAKRLAELEALIP